MREEEHAHRVVIADRIILRRRRRRGPVELLDIPGCHVKLRRRACYRNGSLKVVRPDLLDSAGRPDQGRDLEHLVRRLVLDEVKHARGLCGGHRGGQRSGKEYDGSDRSHGYSSDSLTAPAAKTCRLLRAGKALSSFDPSCDGYKRG